MDDIDNFYYNYISERTEDPTVFLAKNIHKNCKSTSANLNVCCDVKGVNFSVRKGNIFKILSMALI